ncbi:androgen-induced gene 1 protein-like [Diadema antillarum]|uniref:androgen-induced gene 1 protein-like n=1 Tax=Diadema antillarum TaxID=105358 RepID=UPI003A835E8C
MASQVLATIFHFVIFSYYSYVYAYFKMEVDEKLPNHTNYGKDLKFLTIWSMLFQIFYFFICCVTDLIMTSGSRSPIGRRLLAFRDWFLCSLAFPIGALVVVMFWAIFAVDRELIFPKKQEAVYPSWINHAMHTNLLFILLIEMYLVKHNQPRRKTGILSSLFVGLVYIIWLMFLGFNKGIWVYPVLEVLNGIQFVLFFVVAFALFVTAYFVGERCNLALGRNLPDPDLMYAKID